jgi:hypothetical protein
MVTGGDARCPSCGHMWVPFPAEGTQVESP